LHKNKLEAGCDEAGRGCLAGPVFAAAVILPTSFYHPLLNDSKKLTEKTRKILRPIIENKAISWGVAQLDHSEIDKINILQASIKSMHLALDKLTTRPEMILIDGNKFNQYMNIEHTCIIKGDAKFASIAAASILAKTHRDEWMAIIHDSHPKYNWIQNKGYPTKEHRKSIKKYGISPFHRKSFQLLPK
jgi:ribonuclease HII